MNRKSGEGSFQKRVKDFYFIRTFKTYLNKAKR